MWCAWALSPNRCSLRLASPNSVIVSPQHAQRLFWRSNALSWVARENSFGRRDVMPGWHPLDSDLNVSRHGRRCLMHRDSHYRPNMAIAKVTELVRISYSDEAAVAYEQFAPDKSLLQKVATEGNEVLKHFPRLPGACAVMSALYGAILQNKHPGMPIHVIAGRLAVNGRSVFGGAIQTTNWNEAFGQSNPSWDGHCWVVCGDWIADISLGRTAYSVGSPAILTRFVRQEFGNKVGLIMTRNDEQLRYEPLHVLTDEQITGLGRGAMQLIDQSS